MPYLTKKQVAAMKRALARRGQKMPSMGDCKVLPRGGKKRGYTGEVCRDRHGFEYLSYPYKQSRAATLRGSRRRRRK